MPLQYNVVNLPFAQGLQVFLNEDLLLDSMVNDDRYIYEFDTSGSSMVAAMQSGTVEHIQWDSSTNSYEMVVKIKVGAGEYAYDRYTGLQNPMSFTGVGQSIIAGSNLGNMAGTLRVERFGGYNANSNQVNLGTSMAIDFNEIIDADIDPMGGISTYVSMNDQPGASNYDIAWFEEVNQAFSYWNNGYQTNGYSVLNNTNNYEMLGGGDLFGTGRTDVIYRDTSNNDVYVHLGGFESESMYIGNSPGFVDFIGVLENDNGTGKLAWRSNNSQKVYTWDKFDGNYSWDYVGIQPLHWRSGGTADFDGDGMGDIHWELEMNTRSKGYTVIWDDGDKSKAKYTGISGKKWDADAFGDFNGDGKDDIAQVKETGLVYLWNGGIKSNTYAGILGSNQVVLGSADVNQDGQDDLIIRDEGTLEVDAWLSGKEANSVFLSHQSLTWEMV